MSNPFFDHPILNPPYDYPSRHWEFDEHGQPTQQIIESRHRAEFITNTETETEKAEAGSAARILAVRFGPFYCGAAIRLHCDH